MNSSHTSQWRRVHWALATLILAIGGSTGCDPEESPHAGLGQTGSALSVDFIGGTDVIGFRMFVERVACHPGEMFEPFATHADVDLLDGLMPGMVEVLEQRLDPTSRHVGADLFIALPAGCYDVVAAPAVAFDGDDFTPSVDCAAAHARGVEVMPGQTTEPPPMISQCRGAELPGGGDFPVVLNHPPSITIEIDEKLAYECEPVQICATVTDVDDDPIEIEFSVLADGNALHAVDIGDLELLGFARGTRIWRQCASVTLRITDSYDVEVTAYDLAIRDGQPVRFEQLLAEAHGNEPDPPTSSARQLVPLHINWVEEPLCFDGEGALVPAPGVEIIRAEGCEYIDTETYYCEMGREDIRHLVCPEGEFREEALYRPCAACQAAAEVVCDGLDDDCDGRIDEGVANACGECGVLLPDGDGSVCDGVDNDCDGVADEFCGHGPTIEIRYPFEPDPVTTVFADQFDPVRGMRYAEVRLIADVRDAEDGPLDGPAVTWRTDQDDVQPEFLGHGQTPVVRLYGQGQNGTLHRLTVTATDSHGNSTSTAPPRPINIITQR